MVDIEVALQGYFTERELKEVEFNTIYVSLFNHGTDAHTLRCLIAKQASYIRLLEQQLEQKKKE